MALSTTPTIVLLHGWTTDPTVEQKWSAFRQELKDRGIKTEWLALPGLDYPIDKTWSLDDYVSWLKDKLKGKRDLIILGHSFGGQIAIRFAAQNHRQMRKLILVNNAGLKDKSMYMESKRLLFGTSDKVGKLVGFGEAQRRLLYKLAGAQDYLVAPPYLRSTLTAVVNEEVIADAARIKTPTLILWGSEDKVTPLAQGQRFHEAIAGSALMLIEGARHSPIYTHSAAVAKPVEDFVKGRLKVAAQT
jgi:pimeloyl-ACP methyl ester carboxylesterase